MKKQLLSLMALVCSMSMNAQVATTGTATRTGDINVKWVQLWEDGPRFAEYNVGAANNKAEDYGGYYEWGSSIDRDTKDAYKSGSDALSGADDTATNLWGDNWRMPTKEEFQALLDNCDVVWTDNYNGTGIKGKVFTGKGDYASNSVFLPANGMGMSGGVFGKGIQGNYWPSTPDGTTRVFYLVFNSAIQTIESNSSRMSGLAVRAVLADNAAAIEGIVDNAINTVHGKKVIEDGKIIIIGNNGKMYNTVGIEIKK